MMPAWMPELITLPQYHGNWDNYLAATYAAFAQDFLGARPLYDGKRMGLKRHPMSFDKEATFWHFVSKGAVEVDREPDFRRYERIKWPRAMIDHRADPAVKRWTETRGRAERIHLWCEDAMYLVVLDEHDEYVLPWTAYPLQYDHEAAKLNRKWEEHQP